MPLATQNRNDDDNVVSTSHRYCHIRTNTQDIYFEKEIILKQSSLTQTSNFVCDKSHCSLKIILDITARDLRGLHYFSFSIKKCYFMSTYECGFRFFFSFLPANQKPDLNIIKRIKSWDFLLRGSRDVLCSNINTVCPGSLFTKW